jgi:hypothetical protein
MRFACQSCGKAYNLPEERIAEKTNVKLKCRVCGAIVEVKRQGEIVAQILSEGEGKRMGRVSEAPAPLASMNPDDPDDATHAIAFSDHILSEHALSDPIGQPPPRQAPGTLSGGLFATGSGERAFPVMPPAAATGFGGGAGSSPPPLVQSPQRFMRPDAELSSAPPPMPIPGSPPPAFPGLDAPQPILTNGSGHGLSARLEAERFPEDVNAPAMALEGSGSLSVPPPAPVSRADDTTRKILAAFATGMLIGFIIAKLFF